MPLTRASSPSAHTRYSKLARPVGGFILACGIAGCTMIAPAEPQATLTRSVQVKGSPAEVWSQIGSFCAIEVWHPAIGKCSEDGKTPTTRTLVTREGGAIFVELQTARSDAEHRYSYTFTSAPVPVAHYSSTFQVVAAGPGVSTVSWSGVYTPNPGKETTATEALSGIYESGLGAIQARLGK